MRGTSRHVFARAGLRASPLYRASRPVKRPSCDKLILKHEKITLPRSGIKLSSESLGKVRLTMHGCPTLSADRWRRANSSHLPYLCRPPPIGPPQGPEISAQATTSYSLRISELGLTPIPRRGFRLQILAADSIGIEATEQTARRSCLMLKERLLRHRHRLDRGSAVEAGNEPFATAVTEHWRC